jgi:hypothetical protein
VARRNRERLELSKLDATPPWEQRQRVHADATTGPFDVLDAPEDGVDRIDLGALRIPVGPEQDVRLDLNESREIVGVNVVGPNGQLQIGLYAAPRNEGIWDDVRAEISASVAQQKGNPKERTDGAFGTELLGTVPGENGAPVQMRMIGVDGPRWFLRGMLLGPAAADAGGAEAFDETFRGIVVVRGTDPLPVREPVPLQLPEDVVLPEEGQ